MRLPSLFFAFVWSLFGQDSAPAWRGKVEAALAEGRERVALGILASEAENPVLDGGVAAAFVDVLLNLGEVERAEAVAKRWFDESKGAPAARLARARQLWRRGEHAAALTMLAPLLVEGPEKDDAPKWDLEAIALAGDIEVDRGKDAEAEALFDRLVTESQRIVLRDARHLVALSRALLFFGGSQGVNEAEKALIEAQKQKVGPDVDTALGRLYLERKHIQGDAVAEFKAALKKRPTYVPALAGMHAAYESWMREGEAKEALEAAVRVNPSHEDVVGALARDDLQNFQLDLAGEKLTRGLAQAPGHRGLQSLAATRKLLLGDRAGFDAGIGAILAVDPTDGEALRIAAGVLNERRRWPEALALMERAVAIDPKSPAVLDDLARYQLYLGKTIVAVETLKKADAADAFGRPWRGNIQKLLRWIARKYTTLDTDKFAVRVEGESAPALSKVMLPFMERSYAILSAKYQHTPGGIAEERSKMLIEVFREHADFSVRTFGFAGLGALGVCFGPFIAMDAPNAMKPGEFSWARTFHHELAHTMTLGLSKGRVPRWLTEGLSTFEEAEFEPSWTRGMDRELFDAFHTGDLLPIKEFDPAFMSPRIIFAYYQGGLEAGHLVKTYGIDKMIEALRLLGEDQSVEAAFQKAFGVSTETIDRDFKAFVAARIKPMKMQPRYRAEIAARMEEAWKKTPTDDLLVKLAWARMQQGRLADVEALVAEAAKRKLDDPRLVLLEARLAERMSRPDRAKELFAKLEAAGVQDFDLAMDFAKSAERRGDPEAAMKWYREAIACFPTNADKASPRVALARLLRGGGKTADAIALLEEHLRHSPEDLMSRRAVIDAHRVAKDAEKTLLHAEQFILVDPLDAPIHQTKAEVLLDLGRADDAILAADCAVQTTKEAVPKANAHVLAAKALVKLGRKDEARTRLQEALAAAPQHAEAKSMLAELEAVRSEER